MVGRLASIDLLAFGVDSAIAMAGIVLGSKQEF